MKEIIKLFIPPIVLKLKQKLIAQRRVERKTPPVVQRSPETITELDALGFRWRLDMLSVISRSLYDKGVWEPDTTSLICDIVKPGMNVISVGANFGYYVLLLARQVGPSGRVWAFEPTQTFRDQLQWHVDANHVSDIVTIVPFGLSDHKGNADITISPQSASLHYAPGGTRQETINLCRLDDVAPDLGISEIDFVSMDIDGHEPAFLRGAKQTLSKNLPPIAMELAQRCLHFAGSDVREVASLLTEMGYEICSEKTRLPYESELEFLKSCANFNNDANVYVRASSKRQKSEQIAVQPTTGD